MAYLRKAELLEGVRIALSAARTDPLLSAALIELGLTAEKLAEGWSLYEVSASQPVDVTRLHGDRLLATRRAQTLRRELNDDFATALKITKTALRERPDWLTALNIDADEKPGPKRKRRGADQPIEPAASTPEPTAPDQEPPAPDRPRRRKRDRSASGLAEAVRIFCSGALEHAEIGAALAEVGYTPERLTALQAKREAWMQARAAQHQTQGQELGAVMERRAAMAALQKWWRRFTGLTSAGLRDQPELLSKLGVKARGRKKQTR